jgi:hypothetical protein
LLRTADLATIGASEGFVYLDLRVNGGAATTPFRVPESGAAAVTAPSVTNVAMRHPRKA